MKLKSIISYLTIFLSVVITNYSIKNMYTVGTWIVFLPVVLGIIGLCFLKYCKYKMFLAVCNLIFLIVPFITFIRILQTIY